MTSTHPARVLMIGPSLAVRGGISAMERLLLGAAGDDIEFRFVATHQDGTKLAKAVRFAVGLSQAAWTLLVWNPDVSHIHFADRASTVRKGICTLLSRMAGVPVVLHAHAGDFDAFYQVRSRPTRWLIRHMLDSAAALIVLGQGWARFFHEECGVPMSRIHVQANPIRMPPSLERIAHPGFRVLFVGRVSAKKGILDLVDALAGLPHELKRETLLVVCGDGEVHLLEAACSARGVAIALRGWVDREVLEREYQQADVLALPSRFEGMPMAVLEAMSFGVPVVATRVGAVPEVVIDGETGFLVACDDVAGLSEALGMLGRDLSLRTRLGRQAFEQARRYDVSETVRRFASLYSGVIRDRTTSG